MLMLPPDERKTAKFSPENEIQKNIKYTSTRYYRSTKKFGINVDKHDNITIID